MTDMKENERDRGQVTSLRELALDIAPSRDLWPAINAQVSSEGGRGRPVAHEAHSRTRPSRGHLFALAAVVSALAVGMWLGRSFLPGSTGKATSPVTEANEPGVLPAAYVTEPRYVKEHAALVASLERQLKALPPETQTKVLASLATLRKSMSDIQAALGREPGNALLQALLVNTYQDEMRVLATVQEAGDARKEI